ncbi:hypothetical protein Tco_0197737, partial [Tanacetum coccineum]
GEKSPREKTLILALKILDIDTGFEDISTGFEDISTGFEEVNTGGLGVSTGSGPLPKDLKKKNQQEEASLAEAIRLQTLEEEETAKQVHLDALLAKRVGKRKKQKARKGISIDKSPQGDSETDKEESVEAMNPTPLATKSNIVVNWKISQQGQRSVYQIMRANGVDTVNMSFGAMIKDFIREDLIELYRLVMQKYGTNRPENAYDRCQKFNIDPTFVIDPMNQS